WAGWPFCLYRDSFLSIQRWWRDATLGVPGVERHHEELVGFVTRQWLDACSPGNFLATNPVVLEATMRSAGANL
ncbi:poly-beta-hydroxybutyrate polymerase, partial [Escherichia coli]|nr:poly-beta-hydroxybutyrate polymerase [Escherichia coli]